jgi:2-hydroxychromene-2-carboxylate isomerase
MGTVEERTPHFWRKVRYAYMDARRYANAQGLTMKGPRRIYNAFYSSAGMLFAQRHGLFRPYHDTVFRRFWSHDLEIDELGEISGVIADIGGSAKDFEAYVNGPAERSTAASSTKPRRSACSACRLWSSTANCSGAAIASTC